MNENQRRIVVGAGVVIGLMLLFPPYEVKSVGTGYHFILSAKPFHGVVNIGQLFAQWVGVVLVAGVAWLLAR